MKKSIKVLKFLTFFTMSFMVAYLSILMGVKISDLVTETPYHHGIYLRVMGPSLMASFIMGLLGGAMSIANLREL